jgi:hypothetical protein
VTRFAVWGCRSADVPALFAPTGQYRRRGRCQIKIAEQLTVTVHRPRDPGNDAALVRSLILTGRLPCAGDLLDRGAGCKLAR